MKCLTFEKNEDIVCQIGKLIWKNEQSRFIAMMENYDRTMELVDTAYDSAGKSSEQFAKYQDTVEYKINQLSNSWEQ